MKSAILVASTAILLGACSAGSGPEISVTMTAGATSVHLTLSIQFTATVHNSTNKAVTWSLSGDGCSGATCGTISRSGLYTAPASVPNPATVTVKATSVADVSKSASAAITILEGVNAWTWVSGSNVYGQMGIYGARGTAGPSNVPGARVSAVSWIDPSGNLWLFGGDGYASDRIAYLNDLWKYDPIAHEWTWVAGSDVPSQAGSYGTRGIADPMNAPGARTEAVSWTDTSGNLWLFGGFGLDSRHAIGRLNDLWRFDLTTFEWTWVAGHDLYGQAGTYGTKGLPGPSNVPGARTGAAAWSDPGGTLWLYGGNGVDSSGAVGKLNDLWKFDLTTLEWTWISGSNVFGQVGTYGTKGVADPSNAPGARTCAVSWADSDGGMWIFGGLGYDSKGSDHLLNDLWRLDSTTLEWTWVSGSDSIDGVGFYGTKGTAGPLNVPGARTADISWLSTDGTLWLFGGQGFDSVGNHDWLNDLWEFSPITLEWTWKSGSDLCNQDGTYGTKGVADQANVPGARTRPVPWRGSDGNLWLFGGNGNDFSGGFGYLNDLWRYIR